MERLPEPVLHGHISRTTKRRLGGKERSEEEAADQEQLVEIGHVPLANPHPGGASRIKRTPIVHSLRVFIGLALLFFLLTTMCRQFGARLPTPQPSDAPRHVFSEGRAFADLQHLINQIGWRQAGTKENDVHTVNWLLQRLDEIRLEAIKLGTEPPEIEVQHGSGAYTLYFVDAFITNAYSNVTNIIVRVPAKNKIGDLNRPILLVNSHFDSGIGATGASDNGVATVACLEMVTNLIHEPPMDYDVLFLFNGAEEPLLPASHAFVTLHPMAKRVKTVINLDSAGAGGPSLAFQFGSPTLAYAYCKVAPHPHTTVTANEIFDLGLIPSDTDYRIFRDFGDIKGIDMAFYQNGYVYHTILDDLSMVTPGSIQHMGDNTLALIKYMTDRRISKGLLAKPLSSDTRALYTSFFGFTIAFPAPFAFALNFLACVLCVAFGLRSVSNHWVLIKVWLGVLRASAAGFLLAIALMLLLGNVLSRPLSYFSRPTLGTLLYTTAFVLGFLLSFKQTLFSLKERKQARKRLRGEIEELVFHSGTWFFTTLSIIFSAFGLITSSFFMLQSIFLLFSKSCALFYDSFIFPRASHSAQTSRLLGCSNMPKIVFSLLAITPGALWTIPYYQYGLDLLIPLVGRTGIVVPPDLLLGIFTCMMAVCLIVPVLPVLVSAGNLRYLIRTVTAVLVVLAIVAFFSFPYGPTTPKRVVVQHTFHRPVQVIGPRGPQVEAAIFSFNQRDRSGKPDANESFLLIGSFDYIPPDIIFNDLASAPSFKKAEDVLYNFLPVYPFQPFISAIELPASVPSGAELFTTGKLEHPTLRVINDKFHEPTQMRTLVIAVNYTGFELSTVRLDATESPLLEWAFSSGEDWEAGKLPHFTAPSTARGDYFVRHIGGYGTHEWIILIRMNGQDPVRLDVAAMHLKTTPDMEELKRMLPYWTTSYFFYSEVTTWIIA